MEEEKNNIVDNKNNVGELSGIKNNNSNTPKELNDKKQNTKKKKNKKQPFWVWPVKIFILALTLSLLFGIVSEMVLSNANIVICIILIFVLLAISIIFDMIGVAFTSCPIEPLYAMASKKVKGSKKAISLIKNANKVSSLCCDVIGDICGILSGAAGASIAVKIIAGATGSYAIIIATLVSAVIAALTVFGKAMCKNIAITQSVKIVNLVGKCLSIFSKK